MEAAPDRVGWFGWYALAAGEPPAARLLVASGGLKGPPMDGTAEIGYVVLPQFRGRGYATEMVRGLVGWAFGQPGVVRVVGETEWANPASVRVLLQAGFARIGPGPEPGSARFEIRQPDEERS